MSVQPPAAEAEYTSPTYGRLNSLRKKSDFDFVLKGCGFSRTVSAAINAAFLAAEGVLGLKCHFFRSL